MSSNDKSPQDDPPGYNVIAPYAPPDSYPPSAPPPETDLELLKGVPPGLQLLLQINQLIVRERFKVSQSWGNRSFEVLNNVGQRVFQAEKTAACCGPLYHVRVMDNGGTEVLQLLDNCGCVCCPREIEVQCPPGNLIGWVKLHWHSMVVTQMYILNPSKEVVLLIVGPNLQTCMFGNSAFEVKSKDEEHVVGVIRMEGDHFSVSFPLDLDVTVKAGLFGAAMYLENLIVEKKKYVERKARRGNRS